MLMRSDPFRELDRLAQLFFQQSPPARGTVLPTAMPMDAYRQGDQLVVHFDLPGVDPASIDLTVEKNVLTVRAERKWEPTEGQEIIVSERPQGTFSRQLFLSDGVDTENIQASYNQGVLTLHIPIAQQAKPRKVAIAAESGRAPGAAGAIGEQPATTGVPEGSEQPVGAGAASA